MCPLSLDALSDRYAVERELGRGGMGAVYLARDLKLDRPVALKVLPPEFVQDASLRERFLRETRTAASFSHPNIVPVHGIEEREGLVAFAMGYVEGESLTQRVRRQGPLDVRSVVRMLQDVGYALAYAHGRGVVHRDVKPDNIMIERATGRALLMDFGIARAIETPVAGQGLTRVGEVVGTPEYMSPEQAAGDQLDGRTDLYSLGLAALFAISGTAAMAGTSAQQVLAKQLTELPPSAAVLRPDLPPKLCAVIDRCVAKSPDDRFASAEALVDAVDAAQAAAPEIPLPIRMFAHDAETLTFILFFMLVFGWMFGSIVVTGGNMDIGLAILVMLVVGVARIGASFGAGRRLARIGFTSDDVLTGLRGIVGERDAMRAQLRADADTVRRRRRVIRWSIADLTVSALLIVVAFQGRVKTGPLHYTLSGWAATTFIVAAAMLGLGVFGLLRSPLRATVAERLFQRLWLGPLGRFFIRRAVRERGAAPSSRTLSMPGIGAALPAPAVPARSAPAATNATTAEQRLLELERRLAALEKRGG